MKSRMGKAFSFSSKVSGTPSGKVTGTATTIDPVQLKNLTKEFLAEMQVYAMKGCAWFVVVGSLFLSFFGSC